jgi:hypothetical protein
MRMRLSGTDASGAGTYRRQRWAVSDATFLYEATTDTSFSNIGYIRTARGESVIDLFNPAKAENTNLISSGGTFNFITSISGDHNVATAYDGFTIYPSTGTFTGIVRVYGYKNA